MKNIFKYFIMILLAGVASSCLKSNLDELPAFTDAEIISFNFEYRWIVDGIVKIKTLPNSADITSESATIANEITIPDAGGDFTETVRSQVSISNLVGSCYLSTAARIEPLDGAPKLGVPGDFSGSLKYKVTAADGTTKTWTITTVITP